MKINAIIFGMLISVQLFLNYGFAQNEVNTGPEKTNPAASQFTSKNWSDHRTFYNRYTNVIQIRSNGKKGKAKNLTRTIFIKIESGAKCSLTVEQIRYYNNKQQFQVTGKYKTNNDLVNILELLKGFDGALDDDDVSSKLNSKINTDCERLGIYLNSLPNHFDSILTVASTEKTWKKISFVPNATIGFSGSNVYVDTPYFSNIDILNRRDQTKKTTQGYSAGLLFGYRPLPSHYIYSELNFVRMGFQSRYASIDWQTGLLTAGTEPITNYVFKSWSVGIGYIYSTSSGSNFGLIVQTGFYYSFGKLYGNTGIDKKYDVFIDKNRWGVKAGIGFSIRLYDFAKLNIVPQYSWDLTPVNHGQISTKLFLVGVNTGLAFSF